MSKHNAETSFLLLPGVGVKSNCISVKWSKSNVFNGSMKKLERKFKNMFKDISFF